MQYPDFNLIPFTSSGLSDVHSAASPALVDIDGDGDLDAFVGNLNGDIYFFRNTETLGNPIFAATVINPFGLRDMGIYARPTFIDIDNDGDLDAFVGNEDGNTLFFRNTGTTNNPMFAVPINNPFGLGKPDYNAAPRFADIDDDGDLDVFVGNRDGETLLFKNIGTISTPAFVVPANNPFGLSDVESKANPIFADIDGDGDFDAFMGNFEGNTLFFRNTGTTSNPTFTAPSTNPFGMINSGPYVANPTFADIDGDGDLDAFVGNNNGDTQFFKNTGSNTNPIFDPFSTNPFGLIGVGYNANPTFEDIDNDGDLDGFVGSGNGNTLFFRNIGTESNPVFASSDTNPFGLLNVGYDANPHFVDIEGDGDLDVFVSSNHGGDQYSGGRGGSTLFFENTGTANSPVFTSEISPFLMSDVGWSVSPTFVDIDDDGDADAFVGNKDGETLFLVNNSGLLLASTSGNDILTGTLSNNNDTVTYTSSIAPVTVNLNLTTQQNTIGAGLDTLISIENLIGSPFHDNLTGNPENNVLRGGDGNDILRGWSGADTMIGGFGDDTYFVENVGDVVIDSGGLDSISSNVTFFSSVETLILSGALAINGTGNNENNNITGNSVNNVLSGNGGNDTLNGGAGADTLNGGGGDDVYVVDNINDVIIEFPPYLYNGIDSASSNVSYTLSDYVENLTLTGAVVINGTGNSSNNNITGNDAINILTGVAGNDTLNGGVGADTMIGGLGSDSYVVDNVGDVIIENLAEGTDKISSNVTYTLPVNVEYLMLTGALPINGTGSSQANNIIGNLADNQLDGGAANDTLDGGAGDDTLTGWSGADTMLGGLGNDTYLVENAGDVVTESLNQGTDTVSSRVTFTLPNNVENLTQTGTAVVNGTGNANNNIIIGNNAANQLNGGTGNDILDGGLGINRLTGGAGNDIFKFTTTGHIDTITDYNVANDTIQLENAVFTALTTPGTLAAGQFRIGTQAMDANDFIIYNKTAGTLLYDSDGNGAFAPTQIATIGSGLNLTNADIVVS